MDSYVELTSVSEKTLSVLPPVRLWLPPFPSIADTSFPRLPVTTLLNCWLVFVTPT